MIDFSKYQITILPTGAATNPPADWDVDANGLYTYTTGFSSFPSVGAIYTGPSALEVRLSTADSGVTYTLRVDNITGTWSVSGLTLTPPIAPFTATLAELGNPTNTIQLAVTIAPPFPKAELIYGETATILEDTLTVTDGELGSLDEATVDLLTTWPGYKADLTSVGLTKNALSTHPDIPGIFYVRNLRPKPEGSARAITTVSLIGIMAATWEERRLREISAFGQTISVGPIEKIIIVTTAQETGEDPDESADTNVPARRRIPKLDDMGEVVYRTIATPSGVAERWNVNDPSISLTDTYFTRTEPATDVIGQSITGAALTALDPPTPPPYLWADYEEPKRANHPNGWVLGDRKISIIIPGLVWKVVDTIDYYQVNLPD
jgi:hypothetical protein